MFTVNIYHFRNKERLLRREKYNILVALSYSGLYSLIENTLLKTSEYNKKEADSQMIENKLVVTSGEKDRERGNIGVGRERYKLLGVR